MSGAELQGDRAVPEPGRISVVVIGRNEGERLGRCLASIAEVDAAFAPLEIIYVDSNSTDESVWVAEQLGARTIALHAERPTAARGRNAGWRAARGEFVLFLDGDTQLAPYFPGKAIACFAAPFVAIVWGHRRELHPAESIYNRVLDLDWIYPPGSTEFCGGDALFRRRALVETGGFDETLIAGEEPELCQRILRMGGAILHIDEPMTHHHLHITRFGQYWRRAMRAGHAYAEVSARFAATPGRFWRADARRNRVHAIVLIALLLTLPAAALLRSRTAIAVVVLLLALLIARTAWKARWKSDRPATLLLYGVHSHLQQIPIFVGQVLFLLRGSRGVQRGLVEYKKP